MIKVYDIRERQAFVRAIDEVHQSPIIVQLPTVFVLLAAPSSEGAAQLDACKTRLQGKNYGTAIGSLDSFLGQADPQTLPNEFRESAQFEPMMGTFIRLRWRRSDFQSPTIRHGTHQGLLLGGIHRELFRRMEASFRGLPPDPVWGMHNHAGPLCTSCNVSGDPEGSIVDFDKALAFARERGVRMLLTCREAAAELGSYPIFGYEPHRVTVHREGPGLEGLKQRIPERLRSWTQPPSTMPRPYQLASRSGVAPMRWMDRSAPSYSSSGESRSPVTSFKAP
jgi:hypothetical protein